MRQEYLKGDKSHPYLVKESTTGSRHAVDVEAKPGQTATFIAPTKPGRYAFFRTFHPEHQGKAGRYMSSGESGWLARYGPWFVAASFTASGTLHLARPAMFVPLVPHLLPWPTGLVYASGVVELICAVGLWRRDRWAGVGAAALLVILWPANLQAALTAHQGDDVTTRVITLLRLPLQVPLIWFALQSGRTQVSLPPVRS